jgi:hypothetical protein
VTSTVRFVAPVKKAWSRRNEIERRFGRLNRYRRLFSGFGQLDVMFKAFLRFALVVEACSSMLAWTFPQLGRTVHRHNNK